MMNSIIPFCLLLVAAGTFASAQTPGNATGTLTINPHGAFDKGSSEDQTFKLSYAHVRNSKDPFNPTQRLLRIVLSDQPISDEAMEDDIGVTMLVQTGKLHAIEFLLTSKGKPLGGVILYEMSSRSFNEDEFTFKRKTFDNKTLAGTISMDKQGVFTEKTICSCSVTFSAPIQHEPKPTAQGPAAATTGPGKVAAEYMRAARVNDVAALKKVVVVEAIQMMEAPDGKQYIQGIVEWMRPGIDIVRVYEWSTFAKVDFAMKDGTGTTTMALVKINGEWKVR